VRPKEHAPLDSARIAGAARPGTRKSIEEGWISNGRSFVHAKTLDLLKLAIWHINI